MALEFAERAIFDYGRTMERATSDSRGREADGLGRFASEPFFPLEP